MERIVRLRSDCPQCDGSGIRYVDFSGYGFSACTRCQNRESRKVANQVFVMQIAVSVPIALLVSGFLMI